MFERLEIGDRIQIGGGYDMEPQWLHGNKHYTGTVRAFIPGQNELPAAVIELDDEVVFEKVAGLYLVLELRYMGVEWREKETVHVELCDFMPEEKSWQDRRQGKWVESHASYQKL
jgi:hypothetical protein